jgi:hypothetical protein
VSIRPYLPLPISIDEITSDWLTAALRTRAPGATVLKSSIVDVAHSTTTKVRLRLELDEAGKRAGIPELVILKGGFETHSRGLGHMHEREVRGYRDVFPRIPLTTPACYFADYDAERQQGLIIMDDLVARGVEFCHASKPQTLAQIERRLSILARFHAQTWNSPELRGNGRWVDLVDFFDVMRDFFDWSTEPATWQRFVTSPRGAATSIRFHDRAWMIDSWDRMVRFAKTLPYCVLHGDVHLGNLYLDVDGTPGFLDTLASRGPGMLEVSYHVSASLDSFDRAGAERQLVHHYLQELARHGADAPSLDDAMHQYGVFLLYGHLIWMTTEPHMQTEAVNTANAARVSAAMIDHRILELLRTCP